MSRESCCEEMILIVCESGVTDEVVEHLRRAGATHFTLHKGVIGVGETGRHENSQIWPGTNAIIFCCIPDGQVPDVVKSLKDIHDSRPEHTLGLKVFSLPVQELL